METFGQDRISIVVRGTPQVRAGHLRSSLGALSALGADDCERVRQRLGESVQKMEGPLRISWVPIEYAVDLCDAVDGVCGPDRMWAWSRESILETTRGPLLGPLLEGFKRLGLGPGQVFRRLEGGWNLLHRNCGVVRLAEQDGPTHGTVVLEDIPEPVRSRTYLAAIGASLEAIMATLDAREAQVDVELMDATAQFDIRWS